MADHDEAPVFTAADDGFHFDVMSDRWWETETSWFSFHHPERRLGGWLYTMVRPNIGTVAGGAWAWYLGQVDPSGEPGAEVVLTVPEGATAGELVCAGL